MSGSALESPSPPAQIEGIAQGDILPKQAVELFIKGYDRAKNALWVDNVRVDPSKITTDPETPGQVSFVLPERKESVRRVTVRVTSKDRETPPTGGGVVLSFKSAGWLRFNAAGIALTLVVVLAVLLVRLSISARFGWTTNRSWLWLADDQTRSYSLQRIQFVGWTVLAVLAYAYTFISIYEVKNEFKFPVLPENLLHVLEISAGTIALATGVKAVRGAEGAGSSGPVWRDLITAGDVVALDKVQLLVWTLVGWVSFVCAVVGKDPLHVSDSATIPDLSESLWKLAGLSGAIYLSGKIVRDPGPILKAVQATISATNVSFDLRGINLSHDATFYLNAVKIPFTLIGEPAGTAVAADQSKPNLPAVTVDGPKPNARLALGLLVKIDREKLEQLWLTLTAQPKPNQPWSPTAPGQPHAFTIENPDGQRADCTYTILLPAKNNAAPM